MTLTTIRHGLEQANGAAKKAHKSKRSLFDLCAFLWLISQLITAYTAGLRHQKSCERRLKDDVPQS